MAVMSEPLTRSQFNERQVRSCHKGRSKMKVNSKEDDNYV